MFDGLLGGVEDDPGFGGGLLDPKADARARRNAALDNLSMLLAAFSAPAQQRGQAMAAAMGMIGRNEAAQRAQQMQAGRLNMAAKQQQRFADSVAGMDIPPEMRGLIGSLPPAQAAQLLGPLLQQRRSAEFWRQFEGGDAAPAASGGGTPRLGGAAPAGFLDTLRAAENGTGDPGARNPRSTATGDFQFIDSTWRRFAAANPDLFRGMDDAQVLAARADPALSRRAAEWYANENGGVLRQAGLPVNNGTLALAHRFGGGGASAILRAAPETPIGDVVGPDVMRANPDLAGRSVGQVVGGFQSRFGGDAIPAQAGPAPMAPAQPQGIRIGNRTLSQQEFANLVMRAPTPEDRQRLMAIARLQQRDDRVTTAPAGSALLRNGEIVGQVPERPRESEAQRARYMDLFQRGDARTPAETEEMNILRAQLTRPGVQIDQRGPNAFEAEYGQANAKDAAALSDRARAASGTLQTLGLLENLQRQVATGRLTGPMASIGGIAQALGMDLSRINMDPNLPANAETFTALSNSLLVGMIGAGQFPANNFSEADRHFLTAQLPQLANRPEANAVLIAARRAVAQRDIEAEQSWLAARERGQSYEQWRAEWRRQITRPEANIFASVNTPQEAERLAPGTIYFGPGGVVGIR